MAALLGGHWSRPAQAVEGDEASRKVAQRDFSFKFYRLASLSSHDGANMWLADANDAVGYAVSLFSIHDFLLSIDFMNDQ